jgi:hypothetical protein
MENLGLKLYGRDAPMLGGVLPVPDISGWFEGLFPKPNPPAPMVKGQPQEPASNQGRSVVGDIGRQVGEGIETAISNTLGRIFTPENVRDGAVYLGVAVLLIIAVWSMLR